MSGLVRPGKKRVQVIWFLDVRRTTAATKSQKRRRNTHLQTLQPECLSTKP